MPACRGNGRGAIARPERGREGKGHGAGADGRRGEAHVRAYMGCVRTCVEMGVLTWMSMTKIMVENWVMGVSRDSRVTSPGQSHISRGTIVLAGERGRQGSWTSHSGLGAQTHSKWCLVIWVVISR